MNTFRTLLAMNNASHNAAMKARRLSTIANAARKIAQRELNMGVEEIECLRAEDFADCVYFIAEQLNDATY